VLFGSTALTSAHLAAVSLAGLLAVAFATGAQALPTGGEVAAGSASLSTGPGTLTVNQSSSSAILNWQGFSVGQGEAVTFVQPDSQSVALNRVLGADPSSILGSLSANGRVFLVNPNGILFGAGAQVNVGGLVASTLGLTDARFLAGDYRFSSASGAPVLNQGVINADGGYVALLGAKVANDGVISAKLGVVALAAGSAVTLDVGGDGLLSVVVDEGAIDALARNGGMISAGGGHVLMSAISAGELIRTAVNNTGVIEARTLQNHNGVVRLSGGPIGVVEVGGVINVSGSDPGQTGGAVTATGARVGLFNASIDASGDAGGGRVLIGGDLYGANPDIPNALATYMSADSLITADAGAVGAGGTVVLWSDGSTRASGRISARGGALGGDGGMVETSGHWLDVTGVRVTAAAARGLRGTWLLDPADVTIGTGTVGGTFINGVFTPGAGVSAATIDAGDLQAALNAGTDVVITTTNNGASGAGLGDITVGAALTWVTSQKLTLNADHDIIVSPGSAITASTQNSQIVFNAQNDIKIGAALVASAQGSKILLAAGNDVLATAAVTATGLNAVIDMSAGRDISVVAVTANGAGTVTSINLHANNNVTLNGAVNAAGGAILLRADSDGTGPGALAGTVVFAGPAVVGSSATTAIRFNPATYANTATEIANYDAKVTGALDARAWVFPVGVDRPYDGTTAATLQFKNPLADNPNIGNTVTLVAGAAAFDTKDVGILKPITFTGYTLGGGDLARFALFSVIGVAPGAGTTTGNITPIPLIVTADSQAPKLYGATATFAGTAFTSVGLIAGETVASVSLTSAGATPTAPVGSYAIIPSGAAPTATFIPANYTISYVNGVLPVVARPLTVTANSASKTEGDTYIFGPTAFTTSGLQNGETIGAVTETSAGAPVPAAAGSYAIVASNASGGTFNIANYTTTYAPGSLAVVAPTPTPTPTPSPTPTPTPTPPVVTPSPTPTPTPTPAPTPTPGPTELPTPVLPGAPTTVPATPTVHPTPVGTTSTTVDGAPSLVLASVIADEATQTATIRRNVAGGTVGAGAFESQQLSIVGDGVAMPFDLAVALQQPMPTAVAAPDVPADVLAARVQSEGPALAPALRAPIMRAPKQDRH
jgi:filamentous hemagglutinin family protein